MATASQVKTGLDAVSAAIVRARERMVTAKATAAEVSDALAALPTAYGGVISTVNGYGDADAFEVQAKAELAKLTAEFQALKTIVDAVAAINV